MTLKNVVKGAEIKPLDIMGKSIKVFLKAGGKFYFKVTGADVDVNGIVETYLMGFDDQGEDLKISINDIDFIIGG